MARRVAIAFLAAAMTAFATGAATRAEVPPSAPAELAAASAAFDTLVREARQRDTLPRLSVAGDAAILQRLWDADALLGRPPYAAADVPRLLAIVERQSRIIKTYALFSADPAAAPDTARNVATFQDEITRAQAFLIMVFGAAAPALNDLVSRLPPGQFDETRKQGLRQMRLGILEYVSGIVLALRSPALSPANRQRVTQAFADNAVALAALVSGDDRVALSAAMITALPALTGEAQASAKRFIAAMQETPCEGLCALR
ncbi:hypothetical protein [Phreatobacter sp. AB_2022a]|uniref:hypothetical protein n=1 Tax=Phreatobacter sp. AB_2022a TaxID=3003134 RepID=UPI00228728D7|nr:hypothetical protein [Phreatobacter sp. AB_2022a]MCZ0734643.1 hypothetical protein [Phreatobacter sp. AB_2022a]